MLLIVVAIAAFCDKLVIKLPEVLAELDLVESIGELLQSCSHSVPNNEVTASVRHNFCISAGS